MSHCDEMPPADGDEFELPCVEAMLAGTLALMTGHAQACCAGQREAMAHKIVSNMGMLAEHPQLSDPFRCALGRLRCHWELLLERQGAMASSAQPRHAAPATLQ